MITLLVSNGEDFLNSRAPVGSIGIGNYCTLGYQPEYSSSNNTAKTQSFPTAKNSLRSKEYYNFLSTPYLYLCGKKQKFISTVVVSFLNYKKS